MISIIIPAYNVEKYINNCLNHLINQTYIDIEIIVIDDGSKDQTPHILDKYALKDTRIRVIHQENGGVSSARNKGLDEARGEYIFFVDADDWIKEDYLEKLMSYFDDDIDFVGGNCQIVLEEGCKPFKIFDSSKWGKLTKLECIQDAYLNKYYTKVIWGKIYRKKIWDNIRFTAIRYSEDTRAMFEVLERIEYCCIVDIKGYFYLQRASSASHVLKEDVQKGLNTTLDYIYEQAKTKYPEYLSYASRNYINYTYALVKIYISNHKKKEAYDLIHKMQEARKLGKMSNMTRSEKLLGLPDFVVYILLELKICVNKGGTLK